jgi:hypothetical protein
VGGAGAGNDSNESGAAGQGDAASDAEPMGACQQNRAFVAVFTAFVAPTPMDLALGLNSATFGTNPIALVLSGASAEPSLAVSYPTNKDRVRAFPKAATPSPAPAWIADNGFGTSSAQVQGWMLVKAAGGPLEVPLANISVTATTEPDCTHGTAVLTGVIPAASAESLPRLSVPSAEEDPAGNAASDTEDCDQSAPSGAKGASSHQTEPAREKDRDAPADVTVRAMFAIELVDFDGEAFQ